MTLALSESLALGVFIVMFFTTGFRGPLDALNSLFLAPTLQRSVDFNGNPVCEVIKQSISAASAVHWPG